MPEQEPVSLQIKLPIVFLDAEEHIYEQANVFVLTSTLDGVHLTVGQIQPPILLGSSDEQQAQVKQLSYVGVKVLAKLVMTPLRLAELRDAINGQLSQFESRERC
jgi:hypothetical protein